MAAGKVHGQEMTMSPGAEEILKIFLNNPNKEDWSFGLNQSMKSLGKKGGLAAGVVAGSTTQVGRSVGVGCLPNTTFRRRSFRPCSFRLRSAGATIRKRVLLRGRTNGRRNIMAEYLSWPNFCRIFNTFFAAWPK